MSDCAAHEFVLQEMDYRGDWLKMLNTRGADGWLPIGKPTLMIRDPKASLTDESNMVFHWVLYRPVSAASEREGNHG
jgi:hypothetical protein